MTETPHKTDQVIPIPTNKEKFFLEYLMIKKPIFNSILRQLNNGQEIPNKPPILNEMPMRVLAQLLYYNNEFKTLPDTQRSKAVFDYEIKQKIMDKLEISEDNLNAYFSQLRKIRILDGKIINPHFIVYPEDLTFEVLFKFNINEE